MLKKLWERYRRWRDKPMMDMIREYEEAFPGRCLPCEFHAYGLREGLTREPEPPPHDCIRKNQTQK